MTIIWVCSIRWVPTPDCLPRQVGFPAAGSDRRRLARGWARLCAALEADAQQIFRLASRCDRQRIILCKGMSCNSLPSQVYASLRIHKFVIIPLSIAFHIVMPTMFTRTSLVHSKICILHGCVYWYFSTENNNTYLKQHLKKLKHVIDILSS